MTTDYLRLWTDDLLNRKSLTLESRVTVVGERNQHLGPRFEFARVHVTVEPASGFHVVEAVPASEELRVLGYPDCAVFGLLDVLMVAASAPLTDIRVILEKAEHHPVDSSTMAFRHAGRDAGRKIIVSLR